MRIPNDYRNKIREIHQTFTVWLKNELKMDGETKLTYFLT